jgi:hypothetical protein
MASKCLLGLLCALLLGNSRSVWGQAATEEALQRACTCLETVPVTELAIAQLATQVDSCLEEGLYVNLSGVLREQGANLDNDSSMLVLAQYLEQELTRGCRGFRQISQQLAAEQLQEVKQENQRSTGILYALEDQQRFPTFLLLNKEQELEAFLWLHEFDGSTRFMQGIKPYWYTEVEIVWREVELYDASTNSYPFYKEIILIEEKGNIDKRRRKAWIKAYEQSSKRKD